MRPDLIGSQPGAPLLGLSYRLPGSTAMKRVADFLSVYRLYRHHHPARYAARVAWGIAFKGLPF